MKRLQRLALYLPAALLGAVLIALFMAYLWLRARLAIGVLLLTCCLLGCASMHYDTESREEKVVAPERTITTVAPDGTKTTTHEAAVVNVTTKKGRRGAQYPTAEGMKFAGDMLGGVWDSLTSGQLLTVGGGLLALLGIGAKTLHTNAKLKGKEEGWDEREKAAVVQQPIPEKPA